MTNHQCGPRQANHFWVHKKIHTKDEPITSARFTQVNTAAVIAKHVARFPAAPPPPVAPLVTVQALRPSDSRIVSEQLPASNMIAWFRKRREKKRQEQSRGAHQISLYSMRYDSGAHQADLGSVMRRSGAVRVESLFEPPRKNFVDGNGDAQFSLLEATTMGRLDLVREYIKFGIAVDVKDDSGRMALSLAAVCGRVDVVKQLIKFGAAVDAKDYKGRTALSHAAMSGHVKVVQELVKHGAVVETKDNDGRTALSHAAEAGHIDIIQELVTRYLANVNARDYSERGALFYAAQNERRQVVAELLRISTFEIDDDFSESLALFIAAALGDGKLVKKLIKEGHSVQRTIQGGRTPMFIAAQCGQTKVVQILIESGASVFAKSSPSHQRRERDTLLTIAGRAGHMKTFQELVKAGAPVNVRDCEGETPLISAARWDYFAGIQLLIAHGGSLRNCDIPEDEYPLIPGTLKTMSELCTAAFEFESLCSRVLERLQDFCSQLQQKDEDQIQEGALASFMSILFRFCRLLLDITKLQTLRSRFISSRALSNRLHDFHEELDHFADMLGLVHDGEQWRDTWNADQSSHRLRFTELLMSTKLTLDGCNSVSQRREAAMLLQYELRTRGEKNPELQDDTKTLLERFIRAAGIEVPDVPDWFISRDDVEFYSWNFVRSTGSAKLYQGKWLQTSVMVETSDLALNAFKQAAAKWFQLSHPNVVRLFGACHIGSPFVSVYERVPEGRQLQEFLCDESNRVSLWKRLYEAALGLQYLHNRDIAHGDIRSENIIVGSDQVAKWNGVLENHDLVGADERCRLTWMAPELCRSMFSNPRMTPATDIYAFGMCVWEAVTLEIPWRGHSDYEIVSRVSEGMLPERPESIQDVQWDLITRMCAADSSERVTIAYVVNRLKQFVLDHEQSSKAATQDLSSSSGITAV